MAPAAPAEDVPAAHRSPREADHHHSPVPHEAGTPARRRRSRSRGRGAGASAEGTTVAPNRLPEAIAPLSEAFRALGVDETGLQAIAALGYTVPTPIQLAALPLMLDGADVVGLAQTGTGKTIVFGLPLARAIDPELNEVQAVVLVPTRELANQVKDVIEHLGTFYGFRTLGLIGGSRVQTDLAAL